jgi:Peptidase family M28
VPLPRPSVERFLLSAAGRAEVPVSWVRDDETGNSDHREFELLGMPGAKLGVGAGGEPCRHSPCDTPDRLDPRSLRLARLLVERAIGAHSAEPSASRTAALTR